MFEETETKISKRTLLQKYEIPVEFLDFSYIKTCNDGKMMERIVKILKSGEEGFYPDLTNCAEERLRTLKPDSKMLRVEETAIKNESLDHEKKSQIDKEMKLWISDMKQQDKVAMNIKPASKPEIPVRKMKDTSAIPSSKSSRHVERIKSTDYEKWEKFDAEAAELKIDLDEERQRELVETKNKINLEKRNLIEVMEDVEVDCLSQLEKDHLSLKFKEKGNECYKAKDYDEAIKEYTQSIRIKPTAAAFNNRALVYLKLKKYLKVISDTNECLKMESNNIKALLRKGQAFVGQNMYNEAYDTFEKVLVIDGSNEIAQREIAEVKKKMPPRNAFRMKIEEVDNVEIKRVKKIPSKSEKLELPDDVHDVQLPKMVQNIIIDKPTPFDELAAVKKEKPREKLIMPTDGQQKNVKRPLLIEEIN